MNDNDDINKELTSFELIAEIRRDKQSLREHRLHAVLLVIQGMSARKVAELFLESPSTVASWVRKFKKDGIAGLKEDDRPGRPGQLRSDQFGVISDALNQSPSDFGIEGDKWTGQILSEFINQRLGLKVGVRQCQRLLRRLK